MVRNDTKLMESAIALAEELHYQRAARKLGISQPMLTKNIQDVDALVGCPVFLRNQKHVLISEAGRAYVQQARLSLLYGERAVSDARSVGKSMDAPLYVGRSPYVDPFLVTTLTSVRLPLHPTLRLHLVSRYAHDLVHEVLDGTLDLAVINEPSESSTLTQVKVDQTPFYVAMSKQDPLAREQHLNLQSLDQRDLVLFERRLHPVLHDFILERMQLSGARIAAIQQVTAPEEAFPYILNGSVALVVKAGALLLARSGVTVRPIVEDNFILRTYLVTRSDNDSRIVSELVRSFVRKLNQLFGAGEKLLPLFPWFKADSLGGGLEQEQASLGVARPFRRVYDLDLDSPDPIAVGTFHKTGCDSPEIKLREVLGTTASWADMNAFPTLVPIFHAAYQFRLRIRICSTIKPVESHHFIHKLMLCATLRMQKFAAEISFALAPFRYAIS